MLAERYSTAFGLRINFASEYITKENADRIIFSAGLNERTSLQQGGYSKDIEINQTVLTVVLGCVDNNKTRQIISDACKGKHSNYRSVVYIDSGNEEIAGQIVTSFSKVFCPEVRNATNPLRMNPTVVHVPSAFEHFNMEANDRHPDELSCADRAVSAPQNIGTNILAGNIMFNICNQIVSSSSILIEAVHRAMSGSYREDESVSEALRNGDKRDYVRHFLNSVPRIPYHVIYFNSQSSTTTAIDFPAEAQGRF